MKCNDGRGRYKKYGKILTPISDIEFFEGMKTGKFLERKHKGYCALLYYSAVRKIEAGRAKPEQFTIAEDGIWFEVGIRLKKLKHRQKDGTVLSEEEYQAKLIKMKEKFKTPPLFIPIELPYVEEIIWSIKNTERGQKVWDYSDKTYYNIVARVFKYTHLFRLSRITQFFLQGWTIAQVKSWTGLTLSALEFYVGQVDIIKMARAMR